MAGTVLEVEDLAYSAGPAPILDGVSFALGAGELAVVMGASGSGKTTLLRCLNRLHEPTRGTVRLDGRDTATLPAVEVRRRIVLVAQVPFMFPGTVADNLRRAAGYAGRAIDDERAAELLARAGLEGALDRAADSLSVGQQQRVAVARALVLEPRLLLFDEPTASLDAEAALRLEQTLRELAASGTTLAVVTHDAAQAERIADRTLRLEGGRVSAGPRRSPVRAEA